MDPSEREWIIHAFAEAVTMPPRVHEAWLRTGASRRARGFPAADGRRAARLVRKAREELDERDLALMRRVAEYVEETRAEGPPPDGRAHEWRDALRNAGHDPWAARAAERAPIPGAFPDERSTRRSEA